MTLKEHATRQLSGDLQPRDLAEFARKIRRAVESPLKPLVHRVVPIDGEQRDTSLRSSGGPDGPLNHSSQARVR
jgi:hypothetical protein